MSFPRYPKYKPSGVEWLGDVPEGWEVVQFKQFVDIQNGADHKHVETTEGYPVLGSGGIFAYASDFLYDGESVLLGRKGTIDKPLHVTGRFWTVDTMYWTKLNPDTSGRFTYYLALTIPFNYYSTNTALPSMTKGNLNSHLVSRPPLSEQTSIAAFLDRETEKIDGLVAEQRRLLELLKEKRQAVISHAVTKGLNHRAPMKPSGIEWLGDVPEHWKVTRLAYNATIENGTTPSRDNPDYWLDGDIPWLSSGEVNQYRITEASEFITKKALHECSLRLLPRDTIVIGMIGQGKTRGLSASLEIEASINQNLAAIIPSKNLESDYLLYMFQSMYDYLREFGRGGNQAALNCEILSALKMPFPPFEEQLLICEHLGAHLKKFDALTAEAQRAIDLLQERRTALISAAVTGQIDVRKAADIKTA